MKMLPIPAIIFQSSGILEAYYFFRERNFRHVSTPPNQDRTCSLIGSYIACREPLAARTIRSTKNAKSGLEEQTTDPLRPVCATKPPR